MLLPWCNSSKVALGAPGFDSFSSLLSIPMSTATPRLFLRPGTRREKKARAQVSEQSNRPKAAGPRPATRPWPATTCVAAFRVFPRGQQERKGISTAFPTLCRLQLKVFKTLIAKSGRNAAREKSGMRLGKRAEFGASEAPVSFGSYLAILFYLFNFFFPLFLLQRENVPRQGTPARRLQRTPGREAFRATKKATEKAKEKREVLREKGGKKVSLYFFVRVSTSVVVFSSTTLFSLRPQREEEETVVRRFKPLVNLPRLRQRERDKKKQRRERKPATKARTIFR